MIITTNWDIWFPFVLPVHYRDIHIAATASFSALAVIAYLNNPTANGFTNVGRELDWVNLAWVAQGDSVDHAQRVWSY